MLEVVRAHEKQERGDFLHQAKVLVLDHRLVALGDLLVVLEIYELLERPQVLVQLPLDLRLRVRKVRFVGIIQLGESKVRLHLVDRLLHQSASFLAHDIEEEELEVTFIGCCDRWHQLLLNKFAYSLEVDEVSL